MTTYTETITGTYKITFDIETGLVLEKEYKDKRIPIRQREEAPIFNPTTPRDLLQYKNNYPLHIDHEAISLCSIPRLSQDVFREICKSLVYNNITDVSVKQLAEQMNTTPPNISRAISRIPPTMLQKEGKLWKVSPLYACKCPHHYWQLHKENWIKYLTENKYFQC